MLHPESLVRTPEGWNFATEADLEDFVWNHLKQLFGLTPLKRQYIIRTDRCDILALSDSGQLVVIELKNVEDRYIVQQLVRYYHSLLTEKPLADIVEYDQPIRLLAITPNFHRHNHIDQLYNKLLVEFFQFEITQVEYQLTFHLKSQKDEMTLSEKIYYPHEHIVDIIANTPSLRLLPRVPRSLETVLDERHIAEKEIVLNIREKILSFDMRMSEISTKVVTRYGFQQSNGNIPITKLCAEFYSCKMGDFFVIHFSLWLPIPNKRYIGKNIYDGKTQKVLVNTSTKEGSIHSLSVLRNPSPKSSYRPGEDYSLNQYLKIYELMTGNVVGEQSLNSLIKIALDDWKGRVS